MHTLRRKYLLLDHVFQENDGLLGRIIKRTPKPFTYAQQKLFFPPLKREQSRTKKVLGQETIDLETYV
jgi:hypothetical protein